MQRLLVLYLVILVSACESPKIVDPDPPSWRPGLRSLVISSLPLPLRTIDPVATSGPSGVISAARRTPGRPIQERNPQMLRRILIAGLMARAS